MSKKKPKSKSWPGALPHVLALPPMDYVRLRRMAEWLDAMPDDVEPGERFWDRVQEVMDELLTDSQPFLDEQFSALSYQVENDKTAMHGTVPGDLVALVADETDPNAEWHVLLRRIDPS